MPELPPEELSNTLPKSRSLVAAVWLIALSLAVIAVSLVFRLDDPTRGQAYAQPAMSGGARGVFAFTGQLTKDSYGVFMVDTDVGTIWCYRYMTSGQNVLKLVAVRDWRYDRYLQDWATEPPVEVIKEQVNQLRSAARGNAPPSGTPGAAAPGTP